MSESKFHERLALSYWNFKKPKFQPHQSRARCGTAIGTYPIRPSTQHLFCSVAIGIIYAIFVLMAKVIKSANTRLRIGAGCCPEGKIARAPHQFDAGQAPRVPIWISLGLFVLLYSTALSAELQLPVLNTKTKTLAVFKNGLGFFIREGETSLKDGWAITEFVPNAALGSIWISSLDKDINLETVTGYRENIEKDVESISMDELLKANIGKNVIITYGDKIIEGKIKLVPENKPSLREDILSYDYPSSYRPPYSSVTETATIVIIDTRNGAVALNKNGISKIEFDGLPQTKFLVREKAKRMKFKLTPAKNNAKIMLAYLHKGISWMPSYLVNIEDPQKARITMKATLINDVEDLQDVEVFFVVGYPNFMYADVISPMAIEQSVAQFLQALETGGGRSEEYSRLSNIMRQSVTFDEDREIPRLDYGYAAIKGLPGAYEEDLFLYFKKGVDLNKGERAYYHIFSDEVDYKHIYEWIAPDLSGVDPSGYRSSATTQEEKEQVWHSIKLANTTDYPWTTAPAFAINGWKPLAQDIIDYTPKGARTNLKLTIATDIKTDRHEYEAERQRNIVLHGTSYDLVTVKGELYIKNYKSKPVTMEIIKRLTGEIIEVNHNPKIEKIADQIRLRAVNPTTQILWEIPLGAGEEIKLTYKYKIYVQY